jgi:hypothetical protein
VRRRTTTEGSSAPRRVLLESYAMVRSIKLALICGVLAGFCLSPANQARAQAGRNPSNKSVTLIRKVSLLSAGSNVEVEILASQTVTPLITLVTGPDRLVIDLPNSQPSAELHHLNLSRGEVRRVRVGGFASVPPVTRVVLDLDQAETYQVFPSGKTMIVKLSGTKVGDPNRRDIAQLQPVGIPILISEADMPATLPIQPKPRVEVRFNQGMLTIHVNKGTLAEVLSEVHRLTGADIQVPPSAQQEPIVADIGPVPAREAMASLLNGSRFNFIVVGSDGDPNALRSVLLTPKQGDGSMPAGLPPAQEYSSANQPPSEPLPAVQAMPHTEDAPEEAPPATPEVDDMPPQPPLSN